jgi:hypothetical protein
MTGSVYIIAVLSVATICLYSCSFHSVVSSKPDPIVPLKGYGTLDKFPFREAWYGMYFKEDKIGYSHYLIEPSGEDFIVSSDSLMRLTAMQKTNEVTMKEKVKVRPDLTLIDFQSVSRMNGKDLKMTGRNSGDRFKLEIDLDGEKVNQEYPVEGPLYHSSAISLMPALKGLKNGQTLSFKVFNAEKRGMEPVEQYISMVQGEPGPNGAVWQVKNTYGRSPVLSWLDKKGLTVLEKALDGALITMLEDRSTAERFLTQKTTGKDLVLDFSMIKVTKPIANAEKSRLLKVKLDGIEPALIAQDHRQRIAAGSGPKTKAPFEVIVQTEDLAAFKQKDGKSNESRGNEPAEKVSDEYLRSNLSIQSDHHEIVAQARKIVSPDDTDLVKVAKLVQWTAENIKSSTRDSFSALDVLKSKEGECQSHTALYTALARSLKIPTREVTGIVYTERGGFLYHAWAESFVNGWLAVDPTLKQVPADATHIKIASEDKGDDAGTLLKMVGKVKLDVLEYR